MTEAVIEQSELLIEERPLAIVEGKPFITMPDDLYIPPDALEVILETFEGPLDLLLYLIKKQNLDILNIPIALITRQYMEYVDIMKELKLELAAEYLVMAAMLAEIKSRLLLPQVKNEEGEEVDPRAELIRRLQEYERYKKAAEDLEQLPQQGRDVFLAIAETPPLDVPRVLPPVELKELLHAFKQVLIRAELNASHHVQKEVLSIRERMTQVLTKLQHSGYIGFVHLFPQTEGRMGVVVTFIAILELMKQSLIEIIQTESFGSIHIKVQG
ncbi:MAG: segregation/condensation protein A [Proteobacteria bacterium]|nr:segregation/condensation protein A [Pseudomonadota bacterium]